MHHRVTPVILVLGFAGFTALGCADRFTSLTTKRAASDFQCSESEIQVAEKQSGGLALEALYEATGCGKSDTYYTKCNYIGICKTLSSQELAEYNAAVDAQNAAYYENASQSAPPP